MDQPSHFAGSPTQPTSSTTWYVDDSERDEADDYPIDQYDLTATPNDFNVLTINTFVESGAVRIPGFQRNYVWDVKRASKLIESLIIGLPVPQIFLYETSRNGFLVIDGQQRLMSIYYFMKQRFPRKEKRTDLRRIFDDRGKIPDDVLYDDEYFQNFNLQLTEKLPNQSNRFNGLNYSTLGDYRTAFELRPIRNIIVKQVSPKGDDSAIYEIFNRLNSGGINLTPQEIRMSLYHSEFYQMLSRVNIRPKWRKLLGLLEPDLHMKDIEFLLRGFAMLVRGEEYSPSMVRFLNGFSKELKSVDPVAITYLEALFDSFLAACSSLPDGALNSSANRFSVMLFESVFTAICSLPYRSRQLVEVRIDPALLRQLKEDSQFQAAVGRQTTDRMNVSTRLTRAKSILTGR